MKHARTTNVAHRSPMLHLSRSVQAQGPPSQHGGPSAEEGEVIICAAGGGKTTRIVAQALSGAPSRSLIVTYTRNNEKEIRRRFYAKAPVIPSHVEVMTWFAFLLRELARPYRRVLHDRRIDGLQWVEGRSVQYFRVWRRRISADWPTFWMVIQSRTG